MREKKRAHQDHASALDSRARESLKASDIKITEAAVSAWINNDTSLKEFSTKVHQLEDVVEYMETVLKAYEHKRDMLKEVNRIRLTEENNTH